MYVTLFVSLQTNPKYLMELKAKFDVIYMEEAIAL